MAENQQETTAAVIPEEQLPPVPETAILHSNTQPEVDEDATETQQSRILPHPLDEETFEQNRITWREQYLRRFSDAIRSKPNWTSKIDDPAVWKKWILEAKRRESNDTENRSREIEACWYKEDIEFSKEELGLYRDYILGLDKKEGEGAIVPGIDCVWRSDGMIEDELRERLIKQVALLENIPEEKKDWHPGSNNQVLDLVHPSLYPLVYNVTLDVDGNPIPPPRENFKVSDIPAPSEGWRSRYDDEVDLPGYSSQFQWLPSIFHVSEDGKDVKIKSYINNLDSGKQRAEFYPVLEEVFSRFVPMFNNVLRDLAGKKYNARRVDESGDTYEYDDRITPKMWKKYDEAIWEEGGGYLKVPGSEGFEVDEIDEEEEEKDEEYDPDDCVRLWKLGQLTGFKWGPTILDEELEKKVTLNGKDVKVIVKLANIVLTPENPTYPGGSWHVEAMLNERIVSTGIYYYDQENIGDSDLDFRQVSEGWDSEEAEIGGAAAQAVYAMAWEGPSDQEIGEVKTKEHRCIAFPNIFQHKVSSFGLLDPSKPGHRKILVFFVCDPTAGPEEIIATDRIAPQQAPSCAVRNSLLRSNKILGNLPEDVFQLIMSQTPPAMTWEQAKAYREQLMNERKVYNASDRKVQGIKYNLCEH